MEKVFRGIDLESRAAEVRVSGGKIESVRPVPAEAGMPRIFPVLVDLQHNGALGHAYNNLTEDSGPELSSIARHLLANGVGRVLATLTTADYPRLTRGAGALGKLLDSDPLLGTLFPGIFHEGVFISPDAGWRGGHEPSFILPPDWEKFQQLNELSGNRVRVVNIAPEVPGAMEFIRKAVKAGIRVSFGHCHPTAEQIHEAADCGGTMLTHFANGAAPQIHRFQNPFWGFLDEPRLAAGLVGDGFHLPPEVVRVALHCKGEENCYMVSDANIYSGCKPGLYHRIGGLDCVIEPNGFIHVAGQEILAGAWFQQNRSVRFLVEKCGLPLETAWKLCSVYPARIAGIPLPRLEAGEEASFVIVRGCEVEKTIFRGDEYRALS